MTKDEFLKRRGQQSVSEFKEAFEEMLDEWMDIVCSEQYKSLRLSNLCVVFSSKCKYGWKPIVVYDYIEIPHSHAKTEIYDMYPDYYSCHGKFLVFNLCSEKLVYGDYADNQIIEIVSGIFKAKLGDFYKPFDLFKIKQENCRIMIMGKNFQAQMKYEGKCKHTLEVTRLPFLDGRGASGEGPDTELFAWMEQ